MSTVSDIKRISENEVNYYNNFLDKYKKYNKIRVDNALKSIDINNVTVDSLRDDATKLDELINNSIINTKLKISNLPRFNGKSASIFDIENTIQTLDKYNTDINNKIDSFNNKSSSIPIELLELSRAFKIFMYKFLSYQVQSANNALAEYNKPTVNVEDGGGGRRRRTKHAAKSKKSSRRRRRTRRR
jgi:carboxypeptidase C (cathepsin A)